MNISRSEAEGSSETTVMQKRSDIQGLRAIAIVQVVAFHLSMAGFPNGYVGVDIFFILSGFLITMILNHDTQSTTLSLIRTFYVKRMKRIFPAYYLTIAAVILASDVYLIFYDKPSVIDTTLWASVFATNIRGWYLMSDYFAQV